MMRLHATLGTAGLAALALAALQGLPPRDGGAAQAGTEVTASNIPASTGPAVLTPASATRAWTDPPRASPIQDQAAVPAASGPVPGVLAAQPALVAAPLPAVARSDARRAAHRDRRRVAGMNPRPRTLSQSPVQATVKPAPVRMAGPIGDILHGLGLD